MIGFRCASASASRAASRCELVDIDASRSSFVRAGMRGLESVGLVRSMLLLRVPPGGKQPVRRTESEESTRFGRPARSLRAVSGSNRGAILGPSDSCDCCDAPCFAASSLEVHPDSQAEYWHHPVSSVWP